jgi:hypothetical protein
VPDDCRAGGVSETLELLEVLAQQFASAAALERRADQERTFNRLAD